MTEERKAGRPFECSTSDTSLERSEMESFGELD